MSMYRFKIGNDSPYLIRNARSSVAPYAPIETSAVGTLTVRELAADGEEPGTGTPVGGASWPVVFAWSAVDNGFKGIIPGTIDVLDRGIYDIEVTLDGGPGLYHRDVVEMRAFVKG